MNHGRSPCNWTRDLIEKLPRTLLLVHEFPARFFAAAKEVHLAPLLSAAQVPAVTGPGLPAAGEPTRHRPAVAHLPEVPGRQNRTVVPERMPVTRVITTSCSSSHAPRTTAPCSPRTGSVPGFLSSVTSALLRQGSWPTARTWDWAIWLLSPVLDAGPVIHRHSSVQNDLAESEQPSLRLVGHITAPKRAYQSKEHHAVPPQRLPPRRP